MTKGRTQTRLSNKLMVMAILLVAIAMVFSTKARAEVTSKIGSRVLDVSNGRVVLIEGNSEIELAKMLTAKDAIFDDSGNIYVYFRSNTLKVGNIEFGQKLVVIEKDVKSLDITGKGENRRLISYMTKDSITKFPLTKESVKKLLDGSKPSTDNRISIEGTNVIFTDKNGIKYIVSTGKVLDTYGSTSEGIYVFRFKDGSICYLPDLIQAELNKKIELIELERTSKELLFDPKGTVLGYTNTENLIKTIPTAKEIKIALTSTDNRIAIEGTNIIFTDKNGIKYIVSTGKVLDTYGSTSEGIYVFRFKDGSICYLPDLIQAELNKKIELIELEKTSKELLFDQKGTVLGYTNAENLIKTIPTAKEIRAALTAPAPTPVTTPTPSTSPAPTPVGTSPAPTPVTTPSIVPTSKPTSTKPVYAYKLVPKGKKMILKNSQKQKVDEFIKKGKNKIVYKGWKIEGVMLEYVQFNKAGNLVIPYKKSGKCEIINHKTGRKTIVLKKGTKKVTYDDDGFSRNAISKSGRKYSVYKK